MKEKILLASAMSLALLSCSEVDLKEVNHGRPIDFSASTASRAEETTSTNLKEFVVSAYYSNSGATYFDNLVFSRNSLSDTYFQSANDQKKYWPMNGEQLTFVAYSPAASSFNGTLTTSKEGVSVSGFAPYRRVASQIDFIYATNTGNKELNEKTGVKLDFEHALSQIVIMAKNDNTDRTYKVAGVKIVGAVNSGIFGTEGWSAGTEKNTPYKVTYDEPITLEAKEVNLMKTELSAMLVPQQLTAWDLSENNANHGAYIAVKLNISEKGVVGFPKSNEGGTEYGWVAVPIDTKWEPGYKYIYTLDFHTGSGLVAPITGVDPTTDPVITPDDIKDLDPEDPDTPTPTETEETKPGGDNDQEAPKPGDPAQGSPITFTVQITPWVQSTSNPDMNI